MSYTVVFNSNGGDDLNWITYSQTLSNNASVKLDKRKGAFRREGYVFLGWGNATFDTVPAYYDEQYVTNLAESGGTKTLYAVWRKILVNDIMMGMASASSYSKFSQSGAPPVEYDELYRTMGWVCDRASLVYSADTYLGRTVTINRDFHKKYDGWAIAVYQSTPGGYSGPSLLSTIQDNATYRQGSRVLGPDHTFTYKGKTWYLTTGYHANYNSDDKTGDSEGFTMLPIDGTDASMIAVLDALNVSNNPYLNSEYFYKGFEVGKAVINLAKGS